jgi:hypothetical protein
MTTPPPLPAAKPEKFRLPAYAWLVWMLLTGFAVFLGVRHSTENFAYAVGYGLGTGMAAGLLSSLLSWSLWRWGGPSARQFGAHTAVFIGAAVFTVLGLLIKEGKQKVAQAVTVQRMEQDTRDAQTKMLGAIEEKGGIDPEDSVNLLNKASANLDHLAANASGDEREVARVMQAFMQDLQRGSQAYAAAFASLEPDHTFDLTRLADEDARANRRKVIAAFRAANAELRRVYAEGAASIETGLRARGLSEAVVRQTLEQYERSSGAGRERVLAIRDIDGALADLLDQLVDFAAKHEGGWSLEEGTGALLLPSDEAVAEYNRLIERAQAIGQEQLELQRQLLAPKP